MKRMAELLDLSESVSLKLGVKHVESDPWYLDCQLHKTKKTSRAI